jgi:hypothetical protein
MRHTPWARAALLVAGTALAACGGSGGGDASTGVPRTIAYAQSDCHVGLPTRQQLWATDRHGVAHAIADLPSTPPLPPMLCEQYGQGGSGDAAKVAGFLQRLAIGPDGETIVYEITDAFSLDLLGWRGVLADEERGFFVIRSDGSGRRRLASPSRAPSFKFSLDPFGADFSGPTIAFSPDGRSVVFTDLGTAPSGEESIQIVALDVTDGTRRQVTHLDPIVPQSPTALEINGLSFIDSQHIAFAIHSADGLRIETVDVASGEAVTRQPPIAIPGAQLVAAFTITGRDKLLLPLALPGTAENAHPELGLNDVLELFVQSKDDVVQVTRLDRIDTFPGALTRDGRRALFDASTNRLGTNPQQTCQMFSVDTLGGDLQQLTFFDACDDLGCIGDALAPVAYDLERDVIVLESYCDLTGHGAFGDQIYTTRLDGSDLRQVSSARRVVTEADGSVSVELPGYLTYAAVLAPH